MIRVVAIEPYNNLKIGDVEYVSERIAVQLERKGLVVRSLPPESERVQRPTVAAGEDLKSYASQAAQVLDEMIAKPSKRGRPRKGKAAE